jgi:hypothetical protein
VTQRIRRRVLHDERNADQPPREILGQIGRMAGIPIRAVGNDAAMGEVGESCAENHRGPGVDHHQAYDHRAPERRQQRAVCQPLQPVELALVLQVLPLHQEPERFIAGQRHHPTEQRRLGRAHMGIGQSQRQQIAHGYQADIDQECQIAQQLKPELQRCGGRTIVEVLQVVAEVDEHQRQKKALDQPAQPMLA